MHEVEQISPLRQARESVGLTIPGVAQELGIDPGNLSRIERGKQTPSKDLATKLAQRFGLTEMQILYPERYPLDSEPAAPSKGEAAA
jgi:transcriptional regulator with XRE-family HTH domain